MYTSSIPFIQPSGVVWVTTKYESLRDWFLSQLDAPLHEVLVARLRKGGVSTRPSSPTAQKRTIDQAEGAVWGGLRDYLSGLAHTLSPDSPAPLSNDALTLHRFRLAQVSLTSIGPDLSLS